MVTGVAAGRPRKSWRRYSRCCHQVESLSMLILFIIIYQCQRVNKPALAKMIYIVIIFSKNAVNWLLLPWLQGILPLLAILLFCLVLHFHSKATESSQHFTDNQTPKTYCDICHRLMFYRMRHCKKCGSCIHKFDHHCLLMEVCIGQFNHKYYLLFLVFECAAQLVSMIECIRRLSDYVELRPGGFDHLTWKYYCCFLSIMYSILAVCICCVIFPKHIRLISNNTTTWEEAKRAEISYLSRVPTDVRYPFSEGNIENWKNMLRAGRAQPREWRLPRTR